MIAFMDGCRKEKFVSLQKKKTATNDNTEVDFRFAFMRGQGTREVKFHGEMVCQNMCSLIKDLML